MRALIVTNSSNNTMIDKENLAPVPQLSSSPIKPTTILSPTRSKRQRAQSLGNGALADSEPIKTKSPSPKRREVVTLAYPVRN